MTFRHGLQFAAFVRKVVDTEGKGGGDTPRLSMNSALVDVPEKGIEGEEVEAIGSTLLSAHTHGDMICKDVYKGGRDLRQGLSRRENGGSLMALFCKCGLSERSPSSFTVNSGEERRGPH